MERVATKGYFVHEHTRDEDLCPDRPIQIDRSFLLSGREYDRYNQALTAWGLKEGFPGETSVEQMEFRHRQFAWIKSKTPEQVLILRSMIAMTEDPKLERAANTYARARLRALKSQQQEVTAPSNNVSSLQEWLSYVVTQAKQYKLVI